MSRCLSTASLVAVIWVFVGCSKQSTVTLTLDRPIGGDLDPLTEPVPTEMKLQVIRGRDTKIFAAPWPIAGSSLELGELDPGQVDRVILSAYAADGQLVGYGAAGPLDVPEKGGIELVVPFRRPLSYMAGDSQLMVFDTSRPKDKQLLAPLILPLGSPSAYTTAVTGSPDGRYLLVSTTTQSPDTPKLFLVDTKTHGVIREVELPYNAGFLSVSPDNEWIILSPSGLLASTVTFLRLPDLLSGQIGPNSQWTLETEHRPSQATVFATPDGEQRAAILTNRLNIVFDCEDYVSESYLEVVDLGTRARIGTVTLTSGARGVAYSSSWPYVCVALPCESRVVALDPSNFGEYASLNLPAPTDLLVVGDTLLVGNSSQATGSGEGFQAARLLVNIVDLETFVVGSLSAPFFKERIPLYTQDTGDSLTLSLEPEQVRVFRMSVAPGGARLSVLARATYFTGEFEVGQLTVPQTGVESFTYVTMDVGTAEVVGQFRAQCTVDATGGSLELDVDGCEALSSTSQPLPGEEFGPTGLTTLYGAP